MTVALPYGDADILSVKLGDLPLTFHKSQWSRRYDVNIPAEKINAGQIEMNLLWSIPLDKLEKASYGYRAELASLIPTSGYKLTIVLDPDCGYLFADEPSKTELLVFSRDTTDKPDSEPKTYFGSCAIPVTKTIEK
jgi:hypothetical protein